jgi:anti-sigma regulatory factor (Ser/Thr protein kinase)
VTETGFPTLQLRTEVAAPFLPVATAFVETAARAFGFDDAQALRLTLATEEVFAHLYRVALPRGGSVTITCTNAGYYLRIDFSIPVERLDLRAFNLTATVSLHDEAALEEMGLLLASRAVDRFWVRREPGKGHTLSLVKERRYPEPQGDPPPRPRPLTAFSVRPPTSEEIKLFARLAWIPERAPILPGFLRYPGKLADMLDGGEYQAAVAVDAGGNLGGGIVWYAAGEKTVECFGPYRVDTGHGADLAEALFEACVGAIARSRFLGLLNRFPGADLPEGHFESLGSLQIRQEDGSAVAIETRFRLLGEDPGSAVWTHPRLHDFLRREYRRLALPRQIHAAQNEGERRQPHTVLSAECERPRSLVTLRPIAIGADLAQTLAGHLALFGREGLSNILFELDLGQAWQSACVPALLEHGFEPRLVLPYAGSADLVIFQFPLPRA